LAISAFYFEREKEESVLIEIKPNQPISVISYQTKVPAVIALPEKSD